MVNVPTKMVKGFTLVELMISLSIGLVLLAGVVAVFVGMRTTTAQTSTYGELQENGRFAISLLTDDLLKQDFWGDYTGRMSFPNLTSVPPPPLNDCVGGGINNATFPLAVGQFRTIWGQTIAAGSLDPLGCFTSPPGTSSRVGSDVIQLKRVIGNPVPPLNPLNSLPANVVAGNFYLSTNPEFGGIYPAGGVPPMVLDNTRTWLYQHHVYYVRDEVVGNNTVPVLMQGRLANLAMNFTPVVDGIEVIHFMYGIDTDTNPLAPGYGAVNAYIPATAMTNAVWDNAGGSRILAVKIYVLARSISPDNQYTNNNTYQLGNLNIVANDNFRRLLFSSTITLHNARVN